MKNETGAADRATGEIAAALLGGRDARERGRHEEQCAAQREPSSPGSGRLLHRASTASERAIAEIRAASLSLCDTIAQQNLSGLEYVL